MPNTNFTANYFIRRGSMPRLRMSNSELREMSETYKAIEVRKPGEFAEVRRRLYDPGQIKHPVANLSAFGVTVCKQILNRLATASARAHVRSRFADLQLRDLDDIGLTIAERDALLR